MSINKDSRKSKSFGPEMPARGIKVPQLAELAELFVHIAGGMRGMAKLVYDEFNAAASGSLARQRYLDTILQATKFANQQNPRCTDLGLLSDEDLDRQIKEELRELFSEMEARDGNEPS